MKPCFILFGLLLTSPLLAQSAKFRLEILGGVDTSHFPEVSVRLRILDASGEPAKELPDEAIIVYEDGKEVERIRPRVLRELPGSVMLVLDTSGSMERSDKLTDARKAARLFLDTLDKRTGCGLVLFHDKPYFQEAPSEFRVGLADRLETLEPKGGTAWMDAVDQALNQLSSEVGARRKAIVLLTDGRDVNSRKKLEDIIPKAKQLEVPVYCIGLGEPGRNWFVRSMLVLDQSGSMAQQRKMQNLKLAAKRFIDFLPAQQADTSIIAFNSVVTQPEAFSADKSRLQVQVQRLESFGDTAIYDATWNAIANLSEAGKENLSEEAKKNLRRAVILLTDGIDNKSRSHRLDDCISFAKKEKIPVYTLGLGEGRELEEASLSRLANETGGEYFPIRRADLLPEVFEELAIRLHDDGIDEVSLKKLAQSTGGQYLHVRDSKALQSIFKEMAISVDNTHTIRFRSHRQKPDGTARGIDIHLGDIASTSTGYATHGLLVPSRNIKLYLCMLLGLLFFLLVPSLLHKRIKG